MKDNQINYQLVVLLPTKLEEKEKEKIFSQISGFLTPQKAELAKKENLGVKDMVYPIVKQNKADFWELSLTSKNPISFKEMNLFLNRNTNVLRYLVIKK